MMIMKREKLLYFVVPFVLALPIAIGLGSDQRLLHKALQNNFSLGLILIYVGFVMLYCMEMLFRAVRFLLKKVAKLK
jgi:hypothetical protein